MKTSLSVCFLSVMLAVHCGNSDVLAGGDIEPCSTNFLVGRWNVVEFIGKADQPAFTNGAFFFFGADGMCLSAGGDQTLATCWELIVTNGKTAVVQARLPETAQLVEVESANKLRFVPLSQTEGANLQIVLARAVSSALPDPEFTSFLGTWKIAEVQSKSQDIVLCTLYRQGLFIQQTVMDMTGGEWKALKKRGRLSLLIGGRTYDMTAAGTNRWNATARGKYADLVFERHPPSGLGWPHSSTP